MVEWQPESRCWDNFSYVFLTPCATLEGNPWQREQARRNPRASMPSLAPASSGMLLV